MELSDVVYSTLNNKCPRCHEGDVFENKNPYSLKNGLKMHDHCPSCHLKYEREPGYFYGAMYVSYAFQAGIFITLFALSTIWWNLAPWLLASIVIGAVLATFPLIFRWSRIVWINFFTAFDKSYQHSRIEHHHAA